ncbi:hypothetical protein QTP88_025929 [Uroleucon formosanum]
MTDIKDLERLTRGKARAEILHTTVVASIRSVHELVLRISSEPNVVPQFLVAVTDLDMLWTQFKLEDEAVLGFQINLDKTNEYASGLPAEIRALITESKAIADSLIPKGADAVHMSYINCNFASRNVPTPLAPPTVLNNSNSRLPEIPLPKFDGDFKYWPTFQDRFKALVDSRSNLKPIDKMYYLIGCLRGPAAEAVRSIPVASDSYDLAWTTLSNRFNRPRMVATSLVDKLLNVPSSTQESLPELLSFLCEFSESVSLLNALNIPDLSSFLLFALAFRRLPISTCKLFESTVISDYPSMSELLTFVKSRVSILELVGDSSSRTNEGHIMSIATSPGTYYIPHHAMHRPEIDNNKLRVVFDASASNQRGPSLNSCLSPGPILQQDIVDIITRFRLYRHAFTADIEKMYRQISVLPSYRKFQHIVWRESPYDKLCDYELHTVTCGVNYAPFLALRVLKAIAAKDCDKFVSVRAALERQTYVNDICVGADTEQETFELQSNLIMVLRMSGMELKKWSSNTSYVLNLIPADSRASGLLPFDTGDRYSTKMLVIEWHPDRDPDRILLCSPS